MMDDPLARKSPMTCVMRKQTLRSLSLSYQKKDGRPWPRPSFFWYDTDFSEFDSADIIDYILEKSVSYHARPSFFWYDNDKDLKVCFLVTHLDAEFLKSFCFLICITLCT